MQDSTATCEAAFWMLQNPKSASLFGGAAEALMEEPELASSSGTQLPWIMVWTLFMLPNSTSCFPYPVFLISTKSAHKN